MAELYARSRFAGNYVIVQLLFDYLDRFLLTKRVMVPIRDSHCLKHETYLGG